MWKSSLELRENTQATTSYEGQTTDYLSVTMRIPAGTWIATSNLLFIEGRCNEIRKQIQTTESDYYREKLEERLARRTGGMAVIRVGAASEPELKSCKEAFDDAISSAKAAIAEFPERKADRVTD